MAPYLRFQLVVWSEKMSHHPGHFRNDLNFAIERILREAGVEKFATRKAR
jgi:small-conductance mechanosensitive channel